MSEASPPPSERNLEIFFAALERGEAGDRSAFLDAACAGDPGLRQWIEAEIRKQTGAMPAPDRTVALADYSRTEGRLSPSVEAILIALKPEEPGERIGPYLLLEQLGEGGFGIVWKAEQEKPVRRLVALKILKAGMDTRQVVVRFEQERQALAMMDHPGIAKVFDAGATPTGRPYFVMELVRGVPITDHCDEARLTTRQRLELFMRVCYAVQHAHQKGIIHRDLKPSNILVTLDDDGLPVPKVIDLGLAKATQEMHSDHTQLFTRAEQVLGTPLYMSPEQLNGHDVDTRTDIYALGVVIYECLTGRTPFDPDEFMRNFRDQYRKPLQEEDAPRLSAALRTLPQAALKEVASRRGTDPLQLIRTIRGDLDWICMKALERDRRRRYGTVAALSGDIQHYLLNEPITARPPSQWYRIRKVIERNRRGFVAGALFCLIILGGGIFGFVEAVHARAAEARALVLQAQESHLRELAEAQRQRADWERRVARVNEYVADTELAQQSLNSGNLGRALQLLDKHQPEAGADEDLRGFGWSYLWNLCKGDEHRSLPPHGEAAAAVAFSSAGDWAAIGGEQRITVRDAHTTAILATLPAGAVSLAFLHDKQTLFSAQGGVVHLWRTADWKEAASWPDGPGLAALSPDGSRLAMACEGGVRIYAVPSWKEERFLKGAASPFAFAPDGRVLAADGTQGITIWSLEGGSSRVLADTSSILASDEIAFLRPGKMMTFTSDGASLVIAQNGLTEHGIFTLGIWDIASGRQIAAMPEDPERREHTGAITSLAIAPDGKTVATGSLDHSVRLWDLTRRRCTAALQGHQAEVGAIGFSPDGSELISCDRLGQVNAWDLPRKSIEDSIPEIRHPLGFSKDGARLAALTRENAVVIYEASSRKILLRIPLDPVQAQAEPCIAVSGDLETVAEGLDDGSVRLWKTGTAESRAVKIMDQPIELIAMTPDGQTLVVGSRGQHLHTFDLATARNKELPFAAGSVVISPDNGTLAAFSSESAPPHPSEPLDLKANPAERAVNPPSPASAGVPTVHFWDLVAESSIATLRGSDERVLRTGAFSPDSRLFATAALGEGIEIWDAKKGEFVGTCIGHKQLVNAVAFAFDGKSLASASADSTLRIWNVSTCQELLSFEELGANMTSLLFSPDGRSLVVARTARSQPKGLRFYRAPSLAEIDRMSEAQAAAK